MSYIYNSSGKFHFNSLDRCINPISTYFKMEGCTVVIETATVNIGKWSYGVIFEASGHSRGDYVDYNENKRLFNTKEDAYNDALQTIIKYISLFNGNNQYDGILNLLGAKVVSDVRTTSETVNQLTLF